MTHTTQKKLCFLLDSEQGMEFLLDCWPGISLPKSSGSWLKSSGFRLLQQRLCEATAKNTPSKTIPMPWQAFVSTKIPRDEAVLNSLAQAGRCSDFLACPAFKPLSCTDSARVDGCVSGEPVLQACHPSYTKTHIVLLFPSVLRMK